MQPDASPIPHTLSQWLGLVLATLLAAATGWYARRRREPVELDKLRAETRSIHVSSDISLSRELAAVVEKAEQRREQWMALDDERRSQILFWRNRSEELDGQLADAQETIWKLEAQAKLDAVQIEQMAAVLKLKGKNYDDTKDKKVIALLPPKDQNAP